MKALLDACVLYPPVLRNILLQTAHAGLFEPLWSPRILEEWARAAQRLSDQDAQDARISGKRMDLAFPRASWVANQSTMDRLYLPDIHDIHVLASAIDSSADVLVTFNLKDFPKREVFSEGLEVLNPDAFLMRMYVKDASLVEKAILSVHNVAEDMAQEQILIRKLLKRAGLPKLGKAFS